MTTWRTIPGFAGYAINDEGDCVSPLGNEITRVGYKKDRYNLTKKDGTHYNVAISKLLDAARKRGRIIPGTMEEAPIELPENVEEPEVEEAPAEEVVRRKPKTDSANSEYWYSKELKPSRLCHDCKKPTNDYRCPDCQNLWRKKNSITGCGDTSFDVIYGD